jgi:hypothetical protein
MTAVFTIPFLQFPRRHCSLIRVRFLVRPQLLTRL